MSGDFDPRAYAAEDDEPFDPHAYATEDDSFDPKAYAPAPKPEIGGVFGDGPLRAAIVGGAQGGVSDFADEIGGVVGEVSALGQGVKLGPEASQEMRDFEAARPSRYQAVRDPLRAEAQTLQAKHPASYMAGNLLGQVGQQVALPFKAARGWKGAAKMGGLLGGVSGLGNSEADVTKGDWMGALLDTAKGAGVGAGAAVATHGLTQIPSFLRGRALQGAQKALGTLDEAAEAAAEAERRSLQAKANQKAAEVMRAKEVLGRGPVGDPSVEALRRKALADPRFAEAERNAVRNYAENAPGMLDDLGGKRANAAAEWAKPMGETIDQRVGRQLAEQPGLARQALNAGLVEGADAVRGLPGVKQALGVKGRLFPESNPALAYNNYSAAAKALRVPEALISKPGRAVAPRSAPTLSELVETLQATPAESNPWEDTELAEALRRR